MREGPGLPHPLGATWDGEGVNFALFSSSATAVELCLFAPGGTETRRVSLAARTRGVWHAYLPDARPGQHYGYRVYGPYDPPSGHRHNPHKLLLDPYARALSHAPRWDERLCGHDPDGELVPDTFDTAELAPRSVVVDDAFAWGDDRSYE